MYKIITALGNEFINQELRKIKKYDIVFSDIAYQEALLDIVSNKNVDKIIIYENLPGKLKKEEFFYKIRELNKKPEIIVVVDKKNSKIKELLNKIDIYKLLDSKKMTIERIIETIEENVSTEISSEKKETMSQYNKKDKKMHIEFDKKIIVVTGNAGSGKTTVSINLANILSKETNGKVLIIDLDIVSASIDSFLNIPKINKNIKINIDSDKECVLNMCTECIQKNIFDFDMFSNLVIKNNKYNNLHIITGNTSMFVSQNILCDRFYSNIMEKAKEIYDYIIIDTNSSLFLDSTKWAIERADIVYYVLEGTYKDLNILKNNIMVFSKSWDILIDKFNLILNKTNNYSLNKNYIEDITNLKCKETIGYSDIFIKALNNGTPAGLIDNFIKKKFEKILGINNDIRFIEKIRNRIGGI